MGRASRWWKCDLQIATPPWNFRVPSGFSADWSAEADCRAFAEEYVNSIVAKGIEVIALANHNRADEWIDYMRDAAADRLVVLPGMEITTSSGQDGVHLLIVGGDDCTRHDLQQVLHGPCGYNSDHPEFYEDGSPLPSPRTVEQILDELSEKYLVIAPHALNENGIASASTVKGSLRWKALHHPRLNAIDVSDPNAGTEADSFNSRFRRRELSDFPCLEWLPFVATSDAYSLDDLGNRFTWIRMASPTIEALRQAFLDHEARVIPSWDSRASKGQSPNETSHAWIERIALNGLGNSSEGLSLQFDPHLNVIVGGRGSGKSTVVNAMLQAYGSPELLPANIQTECSEFADTVLGSAKIEASHRLRVPQPSEGQPSQDVSWSRDGGSSTYRDGGTVTRTDFKATVISQKELFDRTSSASGDPARASASLLQLVDGWAGIRDSSDTSTPEINRRLDRARRKWEEAIRARVEAEDESSEGQRIATQGRIEDIRARLELFDSAEAAERRSKHERARGDEQAYAAIMEGRREALARVRTFATETLSGTSEESSINDPPLARVHGEAEAVIENTQAAIIKTVDDSRQRLSAIDTEFRSDAWWLEVEVQLNDAAKYLEELAETGLDAEAYASLQAELEAAQQRLVEIATKSAELAGFRKTETQAEEALAAIRAERRTARQTVFDAAQGNGSLRFEVLKESDWSLWSEELRQLAALRSDGYLSEVPQLSRWLWESDDRQDAERKRRIELWRRSLLSGDFGEIIAELGIRQQFWSRLADLDLTHRVSIFTAIPDDVVRMSFLRQGHDNSTDEAWQPVSTGSPGQRSAAMLGLVLAYGDEPLILDQPEDDLDTALVTELVVEHIRRCRHRRQIIVVTHNANIPVNGDADRICVLENRGQALQVAKSGGQEVDGPVEINAVREAIQRIMEGGVAAFVARERRYNNELNRYRAARGELAARHGETTGPSPPPMSQAVDRSR